MSRSSTGRRITSVIAVLGMLIAAPQAAFASARHGGPGHARHAHHPASGQRIVALARTFVGKVRYVEGGASPKRGFDCSGYTKWVYSHTHVARLPHNAERQRTMTGMRPESRAHARPGDLVFYMSGHRAYHVAIYAGHGMQYAAATPRDGLVHQHIWSRHVQFRTDWHWLDGR